MEIFEMIVQGLNNREIADRLLISEGTVKSHVNRLLRKLDLRNRVQVLLYAANYDLIDAGELHA
jgi:DNA-binding NarL/FixJ family response regulator